MMFRKSLAVGLVLLMVVSGFAGLIGGTEESNASNAGHLTPVVQAYNSHAPIRINNNSDFENQASSEGWNGSGTEADPYIIENYDINGTNAGSALYIGNTTVYFVVRNCSLHDASGNSATYFWNSGAAFYNVTNGRLDNNTVSSNLRYGIYLYSSDSNTIINNTVSNNYNGIYLDFYSSNNTIANNTASLNNSGIYLDSSSNNTIANNTASSNNYDGIELYDSHSDVLAGNTMINDGIFIDGSFLNYWNTHTVDITNTVNGKPVYYWKNLTSGTVPAGAGEIILANCSNVIVENQNVSDASVGILMGFSSGNTIANNTASSNSQHGIFLSYSDSNTIINNNASNNYFGIYFYSSNTNTIANNTASSNHDYGIRLDSSSSNTITNNNASNNNYGIYLYSSSNNTIANNTASSNNWNGIYLYWSCSNNTIYHNNFLNNTNQAYDNTGTNRWNASYPEGGNYWSDYNGADNYSGPGQNISGPDGIGDTPYTDISGGSGAQDNYPLMEPWSPSKQGLAEAPWPMFHHGLNHTGMSPYDTSHVDGTLKWSYTTGFWVRSSPSIGGDGTIYVGSNDSKLYAINPDGTLKWNYTTGFRVRCSPAIGGDGTIYVGSTDGKLYAINPDGKLKWNYTTGQIVRSSPAIGGDGTIYVGSLGNQLYAINPDGALKWNYTTGSYVDSSPAIGDDGTIYVGSWGNQLYAINPDSTSKWSYTTGDIVRSSPAIGGDGTIYVGSDDGKLYAINPNGTPKWNYTTGDIVRSSPAIGGDGTIYVGSYDNKLYAINPNGTLKWNYTTGSYVDSSPAIGGDGTIYVGSDDNKLYAFGSSTKPYVTSTQPGSDDTDVTVDTNITVIFSESMNTSVTPTLTQASGTNVTYTFAGWSSTNVANDTATWTHTVWNYNETIELNVSGAQDLAGNVQNNYSWNFTTEVPDTMPPLSSISPISPYWQNSQRTLTLNATDDKALSNITLYYRFSTDNSSWSGWTQFGSPISASGTSWSGTIEFTFSDGDGYYEFRTIARDAAGNNETKTQADAICGYDTTPPEITIDSPSDGAILNTRNVTVSWTGSDATSGIDHYEIRIDSGNWTDVELNTSHDFTALPDGSHTVDVKAVDNASNENTASVTFTVDTTPPTVVSASPTGTGIPLTQNVVVIFNESMNTSVTPPLTQTSGTNVTYTFAGWSTTTVANDTATWTHTAWDYNETIGLNVSGAQDLAGNTQSNYSWSFTTATPHAATAIGPTNTAPSNVASITITYNYNAGTTSVDLYYTTDNGDHWTLIGSDDSIDGSYAWTIPADGTYGWMAVGDGESAPVSGDSPEASSYTYDGTAPEIGITSPSNRTIFNTNSVTASWSASDASGIDHYNYRIDGGAWSTDTSATKYTFSGLSEGSHTVEVMATDGAGNTNTTTVTIMVDTVAPSITITSPADNTLFNTDSVTIDWTGSDATSGIDHYEVRSDSGNWTTVGTNTSYTFTNPSDDSHTVDVKVIDKAGNENTTSTSFTIDTTEPTITQHSPIGQNVSVDSTINLTFSEPMNRASVQITVSGISGTISWNGNTAVFTPAGNLSAGTTYFVNVTGTDRAGNHLMPYTWNFSTAKIITPPAESTTGNISGVVVDENGDPVAGASVAVQGTNITAITDSTGHFLLENVSAGPYNLTISREGFNDTVASVSVTEGETATVNPVLHPLATQPAKGPSMLWWIILVVAVLIVVGLLMRKKGGKEQLSSVYEETANQGQEDADMEEAEDSTKPAEPEAPSSPPSPAPENTQTQKPKFSREQMVANIEKAYREGRMSEEMYRRNMEKFRNM